MSSHHRTVDAVISPSGNLSVMSRWEVSKLLDVEQGGLYPTFHRCALAVLNSGVPIDDGRQLMQRYPDFSIQLIQEERGIKLDVRNAPAEAFVDGEMIHGIREHLFAVLRDLVAGSQFIGLLRFAGIQTQESVTDGIFMLLRHADLLHPRPVPNMVACWGGHSIPRHEYEYSKGVGYELGLRAMDIVTGCGPGAMKGPMKGAAVGHSKQRFAEGRYIGISEPGIIASEAPNPIVNALVVMPDIEKRLEAFVRLAHGIIVFPGGVGTTEEILYLLGLLLHPNNADLPFPVIFTGPADSADYFHQIDSFIAHTLGDAARARYQIIIDDPIRVARAMHDGITEVRSFREERNDAFYFNWSLQIEHAYQQPFAPTHANMQSLDLHRDQPPHVLACHLRRAFSGIVAGNVKEEGLRAVETHGPFELRGDPDIMQPMDKLLHSFAAQQRMKLPGSTYQPCYRIVS